MAAIFEKQIDDGNSKISIVKWNSPCM